MLYLDRDVPLLTGSQYMQVAMGGSCTNRLFNCAALYGVPCIALQDKVNCAMII